MGLYDYSGLLAFEEDTGTLWNPDSDKQDHLHIRAVETDTMPRQIKKQAGKKTVVWFVDDERANREWFAHHHRSHFCVITFSSRDHFKFALDMSVPCDVVVTDIFFPAQPVSTDGEAETLLSIYDKIAEATVSQLGDLWKQEEVHWKLDGFTIAKDVLHRKPPIPLFFFSRKAPLLLSVGEFLGEPFAVRNSYWLIEKPNPGCAAETGRRAAEIQRARIRAVVRERSSFSMRILRSLRVGPVEVKELLRDSH